MVSVYGLRKESGINGKQASAFEANAVLKRSLPLSTSFTALPKVKKGDFEGRNRSLS